MWDGGEIDQLLRAQRLLDEELDPVTRAPRSTFAHAFGSLSV